MLVFVENIKWNVFSDNVNGYRFGYADFDLFKWGDKVTGFGGFPVYQNFFFCDDLCKRARDIA